MSVAFDDLPSLELREISPKRVIALLKLLPEFRTWSAIEQRERRERYERLRRDLSWIKSVYDLGVSDAKKQITPSQGAKEREQIAATAEKLVGLLRKVGDWDFLNRAARDQIESCSTQRKNINAKVAKILTTERRTRKRAKKTTDSGYVYLQLKLTKLESALAKGRDELRAIDLKRAMLGRRLDDAHPEAEEPSASLVLQEVVSALEVVVPLLRDIVDTDHPTQVQAGVRKWVADELRELARKYVRSRSSAATGGKPGPALRFAEAASLIVIPTEGIPWPALQEHWRDRSKTRGSTGNLS